MAKRMILMLLLAAVVLGGIFGFEAFKSNAIKKFLAASARGRRQPARREWC